MIIVDQSTYVFLLNHIDKIFTFVHAQNQIPLIVASKMGKFGDFFVKQSMHVEAVKADVSKLGSLFVKNACVETFAVHDNDTRVFKISRQRQSVVL